jgi:hypothetical protein
LLFEQRIQHNLCPSIVSQRYLSLDDLAEFPHSIAIDIGQHILPLKSWTKHSRAGSWALLLLNLSPTLNQSKYPCIPHGCN